MGSVRLRPGHLAFLLLASCAGWRSPKDVQRDYARSLRPAEVAPEAPAPGVPIRTLRARAYVDREYRAQTLRWSQRIEQQVARANRVLEAQFGARLELVEVREWERADRTGELPVAMAELAALDPGSDVDWVIGFVSSLPVFSASHEQLGLAQLFGRHMVLRGMDSLAEAQAASEALDLLSEDERQDLLRARRVHKETFVLLHEWAHTLGAFHERNPASILSPAYDKSQSGFSPASREVVALGLRTRESRDGSVRAAWGKAYRGLVEKYAASAWDAATREDALRASVAMLGGDTGAGGRPADPPSRAEYARSLCERAVRRSRHDPTTIETCRTAAAVPGADLDIVLGVPQLLAEARDTRGARQALAEAEPVLTARQADGRWWARVAELYAVAGACPDARRVASRLPATNGTRKKVLADCAGAQR